MNNLIKKVYDCEKEKSAMGIAHALLWAVVILIASWLTRGAEHANAFNSIILVVATTAFLFSDRQRKNK